MNYEKDGFGNSTGIALFSSVAMSEDKTAFSLPAIEKSAEEGNAASQYQLGVKYEGGEGVEQNTQKALSGTQKAAEQGHAEKRN